MLQSEAETIQQQIDNENNRHSREITRLKNALEQAKDDTRAKRERDRRNKQIQANSAMQSNTKENKQIQNMDAKQLDCMRCRNQQIIEELQRILSKIELL